MIWIRKFRSQVHILNVLNQNSYAASGCWCCSCDLISPTDSHVKKVSGNPKFVHPHQLLYPYSFQPRPQHPSHGFAPSYQDPISKSYPSLQQYDLSLLGFLHPRIFTEASEINIIFMDAKKFLIKVGKQCSIFMWLQGCASLV